jgi:hypothetical protein
MRIVSLSIIIFLSVAILVPVVTVHHCNTAHGTTSLVTLDVCHRSDGGTPASPDISWICDFGCIVPDTPHQDFQWLSYDEGKPSLLTFVCEHPPKA